MKYVLKIDCEEDILKKAKKKKHIRQGYLGFSKGMSLRIRETDSSGSNENCFELTYKQKANDRVVEIETKIDERDFEDLWGLAVNRLDKIRYELEIEDRDNKKHIWEVDFFKDHNKETYIVVAEHEMPENIKEPEYIPKIIRKNLIYSVKIDDDRFASKKLADVKYSQNLYKTVLESNS